MQVITPRVDCFDYAQPYQTCKEGSIFSLYYFYNVTNADNVCAVGGVLGGV